VLGIFDKGSLKIFAQGWLGTSFLLISASPVARITCVSHQRLAKALLFNEKYT
jgi:hypothetical protein